MDFTRRHSPTDESNRSFSLLLVEFLTEFLRVESHSVGIQRSISRLFKNSQRKLFLVNDRQRQRGRLLVESAVGDFHQSKGKSNFTLEASLRLGS